MKKNVSRHDTAQLNSALISRRSFCATLAAVGALFSTLSLVPHARAAQTRQEISFKLARELFVHAIAYQRDGNERLAHTYAQECLFFLKRLETAEETAAGGVVAVGNHVICEPSFLHVGTAALRFKQERILI